MPLPRVTGALRAFASVSAKDSSLYESTDDIAQKRRQQAQRSSETGLSWSSLVRTVQSKAKADKETVMATIRELTCTAKEIGLTLPSRPVDLCMKDAVRF